MSVLNVAPHSSHPLAPFVRGAVHLVEQDGGLVIPQRFFPEQMEFLDNVSRHDRAIATAGVVIEFATDGTEASLDCRVMRRLNPRHSVYRAVMRGGANTNSSDAAPRYGLAEEGNVDGIDLVVDGRLVATVAPTNGVLRFAFENPAHADVEVRIYLPTIMSVSVGNLRTNGSLKPLPARGYLLALGDSITQGFVCGRPSLSYPVQIANTLGIDLVNQAVAGYVFDEGSLGNFSTWRCEQPEAVIVAYGTNDWAEKRSPGAIEGAAVAYLDRLSWFFPKIPIYILSPLWRADEHEPTPSGRPLTWMHGMLARISSRHPNMHVVDGYHGIPKDPSLMADGVLHPGPECMGLVADLLLEAMCADNLDLQITQHVEHRLGTMGMRPPAAGAFMSREELIDRETALRGKAPESHPQFDRLVRTIWRLRLPDGCPWDKEQTHQSIKSSLIEEAYEVADAIARESLDDLREELGDVLELVLLHAQIAADAHDFNIDDICRELNAKLIRRHPHVFGDPDDKSGDANKDTADDATTSSAAASADVPADADSTPAPADSASAPSGATSAVAPTASTADQVLDIWDSVKKAERAAAGEGDAPAPGLLDSVPMALPALMQAQKISRRAAKAGFEWDTVEDVWQQVAEERAEFEAEEPGSDAATEEFGDMLFALVNVARRCGIDAEEALAASNRKFRRRWSAMEQRADLDTLDTAALNDLWNNIKSDE